MAEGDRLRPIFLEAANPHDLTAEELGDLAQMLRREHPGYVIDTCIRDESGYGVSLAEVLRVYMDVGEFVGNTAAILAPFLTAVAWARKRWTMDKEFRPDLSPRPRIVSLLGPDGREIRSVVIDEPDGEPVDSPAAFHDAGSRLPWPPDR